MNFENPIPPKQFDKKTGKEILTQPPHSGFQWKEGYVLRALTSAEAKTPSQDHERALVGGDPFEWVKIEDVEVSQ